MSGGVRRLAAIMFTDIVGYSALTQRSEQTALELLDEHQKLLRPQFSRFHGRDVKSTGDGFLVEFESALEAVESGVEIQRLLFARNRRPGVERLEVRIGIHVGDVVHSDRDVFGDAVNIAARIEPLADAGGICVSGPVYEQVQNKLAYSWTPVERASLKNIEFPVSVYRLELPWQAPRAGRLTPFVDRTGELDAFNLLVKSASRGEGMLIALSGEAGVGKTRLADELVQHAERLGFRALRGRGYRGEVAAPYAHWAELVREFSKDAPGPLLYKVCADCTHEIVQLVPELTERLGPGPPAPPVNPEQAQLRFFEGISRFFENAARELPLLLVFDDLQWADTASLRLLAHFGRRLGSARVLGVLIFREDEAPESGVLREVVDELGRAHRLVLQPIKRFDAQATAQMMSHLLGSDPKASALVQVVHERTGGNPLFLESVARALIEEGSLIWTEQGWVPKPGVEIRLPLGIRSLIRQRIRSLDESTVTTLRIASVLGAQFSFPALARLTELPEEKLLEQLERSLQARLLLELTLGPGRSLYAFSDSQVRDVLYDEISLVRRSRYHERAGEILERPLPGTEPVAPAELAHHFLLGNDSERALTYTMKAGEEAARFFAREEAIRQFTTARDLLEAGPEDPRRWQVAEKIAEQLNLMGKPEEALALRRQVAQEYERLGLSRAAGNLHRIIAREFSAHNEPVRAREHWERARQLLETGPESVELARLYDTMGGFLYEAGKSEEAVQMYGRAIRIAEAVGDRQVQATARMVLAALVPLGERRQVFEDLEAALRAAQGLEGRWLVPNVEMLVATALLHIRGDGRAALRKLEDAIESARRNHDVLFEMLVKGNLVTYTYFRIGDPERAERACQEYLSYAGEDPRRASATVEIVLADVAQFQGKTDVAEKRLWEAERLLGEGGDWVERAHLQIVQGRCALRRQRPQSAIEHLNSALGLTRLAGPPALNAVFHFEAASQLVEVLLNEGPSSDAESVRQELGRSAELFGEDLGWAYQSRAEGFWALHQRDWATAETNFVKCAALWQKLGWAYELARARSALSRFYESRKVAGRAKPIAEQAAEFFSKIGAKADLEELTAHPEEKPADSTRS